MTFSLITCEMALVYSLTGESISSDISVLHKIFYFTSWENPYPFNGRRKKTQDSGLTAIEMFKIVVCEILFCFAHSGNAVETQISPTFSSPEPKAHNVSL